MAEVKRTKYFKAVRYDHTKAKKIFREVQNEILHNFDFPNMRAQLLYLVKNVQHRLLSRRKANINLTHRAICADYFIDFLIA